MGSWRPSLFVANSGERLGFTPDTGLQCKLKCLHLTALSTTLLVNSKQWTALEYCSADQCSALTLHLSPGLRKKTKESSILCLHRC